MKKYEHTRIPANSSLEELGRYRSEGWRILLVHKFDDKDCFLLEREVKKPTSTKTLDERKNEFAINVVEYAFYYTKSMIEEFTSYWTEHGEKDRKMRFEKQPSFDISRRLKTWARNTNKNVQSRVVENNL